MGGRFVMRLKKRVFLFLLLIYAAFSAAGVFVMLSPSRADRYRVAEIWRGKTPPALFSRDVPILLYHNIDGKGPFSVTSENLRKHFRLMRDSGIKVVSLRDFIGRMERGEPYDGRVAVITFDDGFKSMYTKMMPIAVEFGYPVTLFVYLDFVRGKSEKMLTWSDIADMEKHGIDVQCHTVTHADLTKLVMKGDAASRLALFRELYLSRRVLELKGSKPCDYIAFPYGNYNTSLIYLSRLSGYSRVFTTEFGMNAVTRDNYCLRRHHIKSNYGVDDIKKILGI